MARCMNSFGNPKNPLGGQRGGKCIMAARMKLQNKEKHRADTMACLNDYDYDILLSHTTYIRAEKFILRQILGNILCGTRLSVLGLRILGTDYVPIAVEDNTNNLILPYTKPCMGTFVIRIKNVPEEVDRIRKNFERTITLKQWRKHADEKLVK